MGRLPARAISGSARSQPERLSKRRPQRARSDEAKSDRRAAVLRAAAELFRKHELDELTMASLAAKTKLAKGTLYLYFPTKEAVFLELLLNEAGEWISALSSELANTGAAEVPALAARSLASRPMLRRLLSVVHTTLERNADYETVVAAKVRLLGLLAPLAAAFEARLPALREGGGVSFIMRMHALSVGLGQMAEPGEVVARALERQELAAFRVDFEQELRAALEDWLLGIGARRRSKPR